MTGSLNGLIFYDHYKKGVISTSQVNCFYRRICEKAGIDFHGRHSLRHTFAASALLILTAISTSTTASTAANQNGRCAMPLRPNSVFTTDIMNGDEN